MTAVIYIFLKIIITRQQLESDVTSFTSRKISVIASNLSYEFQEKGTRVRVMGGGSCAP